MKKAGMWLMIFSGGTLLARTAGSFFGAAMAGSPGYITPQRLLSQSLGFILFFVIGLILFIVGKITRANAMKRYAHITIRAMNGSWQCPICRSDNLYTSQCEKCHFTPAHIDDQTPDEDEQYNTPSL